MDHIINKLIRLLKEYSFIFITIGIMIGAALLSTTVVLLSEHDRNVNIQENNKQQSICNNQALGFASSDYADYRQCVLNQKGDYCYCLGLVSSLPNKE